ncbi:hypothetical protein ES702_05042 [subsurface metagenome]
MKIPIFMIFQFFGVISKWAVKALEDGKVTAAEGLELVDSLAGLLGVRPEFNVSDYLTPPSPEDDILSLPALDEPSGDPEIPRGPVKPQPPVL